MGRKKGWTAEGYNDQDEQIASQRWMRRNLSDEQIEEYRAWIEKYNAKLPAIKCMRESLILDAGFRPQGEESEELRVSRLLGVPAKPAREPEEAIERHKTLRAWDPCLGPTRVCKLMTKIDRLREFVYTIRTGSGGGRWEYELEEQRRHLVFVDRARTELDKVLTEMSGDQKKEMLYKIARGLGQGDSIRAIAVEQGLSYSMVQRVAATISKLMGDFVCDGKGGDLRRARVKSVKSRY